MVGLPEAGLNLAEATILLASSPKSNKAAMAFWSAMEDVQTRDIDPVPDHLRDTHYSGAKKLGYGKGYKYPHEFGGYVSQQYLPNDLYEEGVRYYEPSENGSEAGFKKFLEELRRKYGNN